MNKVTGAILVLAAAILLPPTREDVRNLLFLVVGAVGLGFLAWGLATEREGKKTKS